MPIAHTWGGWIAMTMNFLPVLGTTGAHGNIHYAAGYNGHGVAAASAMGPIVADAVLRRPNPNAEQFKRFPVPLPPEPLRWLMLRGMLGLVNAIDRRLDAQVRRGAANPERFDDLLKLWKRLQRWEKDGRVESAQDSWSERAPMVGRAAGGARAGEEPEASP